MARCGEKMHNSGTRSSFFPICPSPKGPAATWAGATSCSDYPTRHCPDLAFSRSLRVCPCRPAGHSLWNCLAGARSRASRGRPLWGLKLLPTHS